MFLSKQMIILKSLQVCQTPMSRTSLSSLEQCSLCWCLMSWSSLGFLKWTKTQMVCFLFRIFSSCLLFEAHLFFFLLQVTTLLMWVFLKTPPQLCLSLRCLMKQEFRALWFLSQKIYITNISIITSLTEDTFCAIFRMFVRSETPNRPLVSGGHVAKVQCVCDSAAALVSKSDLFTLKLCVFVFRLKWWTVCASRS